MAHNPAKEFAYHVDFVQFDALAGREGKQGVGQFFCHWKRAAHNVRHGIVGCTAMTTGMEVSPRYHVSA